jgi:hypothetical protein
MPRNLWPDFPLKQNNRALKRILFSEGRGIEDKTEGAIRFELETRANDAKEGFVHHGYLAVPNVGYRYPFLRVHHGREPYPATIVADAFSRDVVVHNEKEFLATLERLFQDDTTKKTVQQLLDVAL